MWKIKTSFKPSLLRDLNRQLRDQMSTDLSSYFPHIQCINFIVGMSWILLLAFWNFPMFNTELPFVCLFWPSYIFIGYLDVEKNKLSWWCSKVDCFWSSLCERDNQRSYNLFFPLLTFFHSKIMWRDTILRKRFLKIVSYFIFIIVYDHK